MELDLTKINEQTLALSSRIHKALPILLDNSYSISEIAFQVIYNDPNYFTKCFRKEHGI